MKAAASRASRSRVAWSAAGRLVLLTCPIVTAPTDNGSGPAAHQGHRAVRGPGYDSLLGEADASSDGAASFEAPAAGDAEAVGFWQPFCLAIASPTSPD